VIGLFRRQGWQRATAPDATAEEGKAVGILRRWRRYLTANNLFIAAMILVLAFLMARRQGFILASPSIEGRAQDERTVIAPEFVLPDLSGAPVRLSEHEGKLILLNFWATWCPPCRAEMPSMEALYQAYRNQGLVILAISSDRAGRSVVESFVQDRGVTFPILLDPDGEVFALYGVRGLPTSYLLDRRQRAFSADVGARDWSGKVARQVVETLLKEE
jgi:thiol-disulfide isomerase/thioredoxin